MMLLLPGAGTKHWHSLPSWRTMNSDVTGALDTWILQRYTWHPFLAGTSLTRGSPQSFQEPMSEKSSSNPSPFSWAPLASRKRHSSLLAPRGSQSTSSSLQGAGTSSSQLAPSVPVGPSISSPSGKNLLCQSRPCVTWNSSRPGALRGRTRALQTGSFAERGCSAVKVQLLQLPARKYSESSGCNPDPPEQRAPESSSASGGSSLPPRA
mmetsp:Transcript_62640/g.186698  ORF Transcript_62640/g.186698 Transcript_62640/m.186698 type:complete len:209 (+) Transcript_62640:178-804(+)